MPLDLWGRIGDRPLLALVARLRAGAAEDQRAERIAAMQRTVAAAADVVEAAPVDELVTGRGRHEQVAGGRAGERRPQALERVRVAAARDALIVRVELERALVALDRPAAAAQVAQVASRREAQLADALSGVRAA